jgi:hypothetical protein
MRASTSFADEAKLRLLLDRLNSVPGISIPPDGISRFPSVPLTALQDMPARSQFFAVLDSMLDEIRAA